MPTLRKTKTHENLKAFFASEGCRGFSGNCRIVSRHSRGRSGPRKRLSGSLACVRRSRDRGTTPDNLETAVAGETLEYARLYPDMAGTAPDEEFPDIAEWFDRLAKAERNHAERF